MIFNKDNKLSIFGDVMKGTKDKDKIWFWATIATTLFVMLLFALPTIIIDPYFHYHGASLPRNLRGRDATFFEEKTFQLKIIS